MVSSVSFGQKMGVFDSAADVVNKPQTQTRTSSASVETKPDTVEVNGKKKHSAGKVIAGILGTAVVGAGLLAAGKHFGAFNVEKVADLTKSFKDNKLVSWAKTPAKAILNGLDKAGGFIIEKSKAAYEFGKSFISKKPEGGETAGIIA